MQRSLLLLSWLVLSAIHLTATGNTEQRPDGRAIYNFRCYFCHGYSGDAKTLAATWLSPKPRDFTSLSLDDLSREEMLRAVTHGKPDTAMVGFERVLDGREVEAVVDFVRDEFMQRKARNTTYHSPVNGWSSSLEDSPAYRFATGDLAVDTPVTMLSVADQIGRSIFLTTCITCHDRGRVLDEGPIWESRSLSYPRNNYTNKNPARANTTAEPSADGITGASTFAIHDIPPEMTDPTAAELAGEKLFQANCAFCHGADGTGKNWIGSFLVPKPRNLTDPKFMRTMTRAQLTKRIENGIEGTSMPAWENVLSPNEVRHIVDYISAALHQLPE